MEELLKLHRHSEGEHVEDELRYYRPASFKVPITLAGLQMVLTRDNPHSDYYYDALGEDGPLLRAAGCSFRLREKPHNKERLVTFKRKISDDKGRAKRAETECAIHCFACNNSGQGCSVCKAEDLTELFNHSDIEPLKNAAAIIGDSPLRRMFCILNDRKDHHFKSGNTHVVLSEDHLDFPDGSSEQRIEIEMVTGDAKILEIIDTELKASYPKLKICKRGKLSEGRRRMRNLLG